MDIKSNKSNKGLIILIVILSLFVVGLGSYIVYDKLLSSKNGEEKESKDIYEKLLEGDFSGVAGKYSNSTGDTIELLSNGDIVFSDYTLKMDGNIEKASDLEVKDAYSWNSSNPNDPYSGGITIIYPIGVKVWNGDKYLDDTSKIRLTHGNGWPTAETVYYKK